MKPHETNDQNLYIYLKITSSFQPWQKQNCALLKLLSYWIACSIQISQHICAIWPIFFKLYSCILPDAYMVDTGWSVQTLLFLAWYLFLYHQTYMGTSPHFSAIVYNGKPFFLLSIWFPGWQSLSKMGSTLKGKNLLQWEQILSFKSWPH